MAKATSTAERYTPAQYQQILETIASRMATLHQLIMLANDPCQGDFVNGVCAEAADAFALSIGAMADTAVRPEGEILGDADRWHYGPGFSDLGKEVRHG